MPIWSQRGNHGGYAIDPAETPLNFTAGEATAVALALAVLAPSPFGDD